MCVLWLLWHSTYPVVKIVDLGFGLCFGLVVFGILGHGERTHRFICRGWIKKTNVSCWQWARKKEKTNFSSAGMRERWDVLFIIPKQQEQFFFSFQQSFRGDVRHVMLGLILVDRATMIKQYPGRVGV